MAQRERETLEVDVLFVGAGPASLSGALHLRQLVEAHNQNAASGARKLDSVSIAVIEKGREIGAHTLSGAIVDPVALKELLPNYKDLGAPLGTPVTHDTVCFLTTAGKFALPFVPPPLRNHGNSIISLNRFVKWMGERAEARGIDLFPGFAGTELLFDGKRLIGVRTGDRGIDKYGNPLDSFEPGVDILAKAVVFGEGVRGSLTKQLVSRLQLDAGKSPQVYAIGVKEVWELPEESAEKGHVVHTLGYPLKHENYGGGFIYNMGRMLSIGLVVGLDYRDPYLDPHQEFQRFKTHPFVSCMLKNAKLAHYGAKAIPEGGYYTIPRSYFDGGLVIGDSASLLNSQRLKGIHLAMKSGMLAAETLLAALLNNDFSEQSLKTYEDKLLASWAGKELYGVRNFHQGFEHGLLPGVLNAGLQMVTGGRGWKDPLPNSAGHERLQKVRDHDGPSTQPSPMEVDGKLTFNKVTNVYFSGAKHEENQPSHLIIGDLSICHTRCVEEFSNPCQRFCPANVYEMVDRGDGQGKQLTLNPSNCVHCKTCDIMDPYQIITWVPPEGGGGPNYVNL
ncbi:MAG: electron transfer flavoprotein-ubiquinone oxidoreductase [Acidobacteria bacterium]|nr:electron transfer flavoprotein-ubiquinone oxidoreductase [Acidobacteriota bacterium]MCI0721257.1 electron transfer flavoprotein-ubiquinone oxidoreductase [Acidobacteriota bacterium]